MPHSLISTAKKVGGRVWHNRLQLIFTVIYLVVSLYTMAHFLNTSLLGDRYYKSPFGAMYEGTAWRPFVYRQLVPKTVRVIVRATPTSVREDVNSAVRYFNNSPRFERIHNLMPWLAGVLGKSGSYPRVVTILLLYGCLLGYALALQKLAVVLFPGNEAIRYLAPIFAMLAISSFSKPGTQYIYDIPVLLLSTLCYWCLAKKRLLLYLFIFGLACFNRETSVFILLFFAIWFIRRMDWESYVMWMSLQVMVYAVIRIALILAYKHNAGPILEQHFVDVLYTDPMSRATAYRIITFLLVFLLFTAHWHEKPAFLKTSLWVLPCVVLAYFLYGFPREYRIVFDLLPMLMLLVTHSLVALGGFTRAGIFAMPPDKRGPP